MSMDDAIEANLTRLMAHAWWSREIDWTREWYNGFYAPLLAEGLMLPPLLAYDMRSAAERGDRRRGAAAGKRQNAQCWDAFMIWAHRVCAGSLAAAQAARFDRRTGAALRLARSMATSLMERVDISDLRSRGGEFDPRGLLELEARRLSGDRPAESVMARLWSVVDGAVARHAFFDLVSIAECIPFQGRVGDDLDPFVPKLLGSDPTRKDLQEPPIRGTNPKADNPRVMLTPTGEFAKRDLGGIPGDLARLAPTELLMLRESGSGPKGGKLGARRVAYRTLFLYRAVHGHLLQRFSHSVRPAEMEPVVHLQVDLLDAPEAHRLTDPPNPPSISWYRALAVEVVHSLARLSVPFRWEVSVRLQCSDGPRVGQAIFSGLEMAELGVSRRRALEVLAGGLPEAFASRRGVRRDGWGGNETEVSQPDLWLRVVLGERDQTTGDLLLRDRLRAPHERAVRVERVRNGDYGFAVTENAAEAHLLHVDLSQRSASPALVGSELVSVLLGLGDEEVVGGPS